MTTYTQNDVLVLAKRHHNTKRTYLLVNPLQAKHLPVSPSKSLEMMTCLGKQIAQKYPSAKLVIGFAETATAIAATVAGCLDTDCKYIHTTREAYSDLANWVYFSEEHSHAVEQKLYTKDLAEWISESPQIIFVDDEISTGKTLLNIIDQLRETFPEVKTKQIVAASIINRLSPEHEARFRNAGIASEFLVKVSNTDLTSAVAQFEIRTAELVVSAGTAYEENTIHTQEPLMNPRLGVDISKYIDNCQTVAESAMTKISELIASASSILVLGTEECMYPALILGRELEKQFPTISVKCHATTRSPIGICSDLSYPIHLGYKIHSFYDDVRETFIYNLDCYDIVIVLTDTCSNDLQARADISQALRTKGCLKILFVEGGCRV